MIEARCAISNQSFTDLCRSIALVKGADAEERQGHRSSLVGQNKICQTVAFAESYLFYK